MGFLVESGSSSQPNKVVVESLVESCLWVNGESQRGGNGVEGKGERASSRSRGTLSVYQQAKCWWIEVDWEEGLLWAGWSRTK